MPARNAEGTIRQSLVDIFRQSKQPEEVIVVDDGSTDGTFALVSRLMTRWERLRVVRSNGMGLAGALNLGIAEADSFWVARADADDLYPQSRFADQLRLCRDDTVLVTGDYELFIGQNGRSMGVIPNAVFSDAIKLSLVRPVRIPHPGVLLRRDAVIAVGGYHPHEFPAEDVGLWLRLAHTGCFVGTDTCVVRYRMHAGSVTQGALEVQRRRVSELQQRYGLPLARIDDGRLESLWSDYGRKSLPSARRGLMIFDALSAGEVDRWRRARTSLQCARLLTDDLQVPAEMLRLLSQSRRRRRVRLSL